MSTMAYQSRGWAGVTASATGFFRVTQIDGRWWVIDPAGNGFLIIGTDHVSYQAGWCEALGHSPYQRNCEAKYGNEDKWAAATVSRLLSWGFNSLGAADAQTTRYRGLAHTAFAAWGTEFARIDGIAPRTWWTGVPNVFSPAFAAFCDEKAAEVCAPMRDDPWLIGWFLDNELEWYGSYGKAFGDFSSPERPLLRDAFRKPPADPARQAVIAQLRRKYGTADRFNRAWRTGLRGLDELETLNDLPAPNTKDAHADALAYVREVAERYFSVLTAAIRRHDPNHMVLGCRFAGKPPEIWDIVGRYCDIVSVNCYRFLDLTLGVFIDGFDAELAEWHSKCGRPLLISEWSFPALDAGLPCRNGGGQRLPTQKERALAFRLFQEFLFSRPYVVGSDYFMWADEPKLGISRSFPEDSNYGLVDVNDDAYLLLTQAAMNLNPRLYAIHSGNTEEKLFVSLRPAVTNPSFAGNESFVLMASNGLKEAFAGSVRLEFRGGKGRLAGPGQAALRLAPGEERSVNVVLRCRPGAGELAIRAVSDDPGVYGLEWVWESRQELRVPCSRTTCRVTLRWLRQGGCLDLRSCKSQVARAFLRVAGGRLHFLFEVRDDQIRVNRALLWDGSSVELFFKSPYAASLLHQFTVVPDPKDAGLLDLGGRPVAGAEVRMRRQPHGYALDGFAPLDRLGIAHPGEPWYMDVVVTANCLAGEGRLRIPWSGQGGSHESFRHYAVVVPYKARAEDVPRVASRTLAVRAAGSAEKTT